MKIPYVSGGHYNRPKTQIPGQYKNMSKQLKTCISCILGRAKKNSWPGKPYGLREALEILRGKYVSQPAEQAARNSNPKRFTAHGEESRWDPIENVGIPCVLRWPKPGNSVNLGMPLAPPEKPYGLLETWEIIGFPLHFHLELRMAD